MLMTLRSNDLFPDQNNTQSFSNYSTQAGQHIAKTSSYPDEAAAPLQSSSARSRPRRQSSLTPLTTALGSPRSRPPQQMNGLPQPVMYVRALYDYEADDRTSLSFHEGDVIQVITQLESGWWDGVINGVRGWFPSNYCQVIANPDDPLDPHGRELDDEADEEDEDQDDYEDQYDDDADSDYGDPPHLSNDGHERTRADFWIPQATSDGRLFYFNTETGESSTELPLESPSSPSETGPRNRMNVNIPEKTRPPTEMMARGYMQDEADESDGNSASELDGESIMLASQNSYAVSSPACATPSS
jgi:son of sevenless-like protein